MIIFLCAAGEICNIFEARGILVCSKQQEIVDRKRCLRERNRQNVLVQEYLRPVYKPHSVQQIALPGQVIYLGSASPRCSVQPTRGCAETSSLPSSVDDFAPAWPCSRRGLPGRLHYCKRRWSLTPPFHHHQPPRGLAVCFCGPVRRVAPPRMLSDAVLCGVRTFLDPDNAGPQLPDQPEVTASYTLERCESTLADSNSALKVDISRKDIKIETYFIFVSKGTPCE